MKAAALLRAGRALLTLGVVAVIAAPVAIVPGRAQAPEDAAEERKELVVLVHGMGRTRLSMWLLGESLERRGYRVLNWGYPSTTDSIPVLGARLAGAVDAAAGEAPRVHFVGHSLGNILIRWTLASRPPEHPGRVVMLAPPNRGSAAADRYAPYMAWLMPPIAELRTDSGTVRAIPAPRGVDVGVIAGAHDGKVSVEETYLPGMRDHLVVPAAHSFIMNRGDVQRYVDRFLRTGTFGAGGDAAEPADRPGA